MEKLIYPQDCTLLPFQADCIHKMLAFLRNGGGCYNACEMGLGKSVQAIVAMNTILRYELLPKILIVCPAVMRLVWRAELQKWLTSLHPSVQVLTSSKQLKQKSMWHAVTIISYDLAATDEFKKWAEPSYDMLIMDEAHYCVAEDTLINTPAGLVPIKSLVEGDIVTTISDNGADTGRIIRKIKGNEKEPKRKITLSNGYTLEGLDWHLVRTPLQWTELGKLQVSDPVSVVQKGLGRTLPIMGNVENFLQRQMCKAKPLSQRWVVRSYAKKEPYEDSCGKNEDAGHTETYRTQTSTTGRERQESTIGTGKIKAIMQIGISAVSGSVRVCSWARMQAARISYSVQTRCGYTRIKTRGRGRRVFSSKPSQETTRFEERQEIETARVENIEIYEHGDTGEAGKCYYDLELDRHHNYIANGIIVHNCKSPKAKRTKAILKHIWPRAVFKICLSGTPFTNNVIDGYTLFNKLAPYDFPDFWSFANTYSHRKNNGFGITWEGLKNADKLRAIINNNFFLRKTKAQVLPELPPKVYQKITLDESYAHKLTKEQEAEYERYYQDLKRLLAGKETTRIPPPPVSIMTVRREQGLKKVKPIIEFVKNMLEQNVPVVLFGIFRDVLTEFEETFKSYKPAVIHGDVSAKKRQEEIERFQAGDTDLFIGQLTAAGVGITLTRASDVVLAELSYSPAEISQAVDRTHRISQKNSVTVHYFAVENSVDEKIIDIVMDKAKIFSEILKEEK
jgi:SWI/SNF-related matrix-associated actin-dependent regulator 1 of chromatin subfamily A